LDNLETNEGDILHTEFNANSNPGFIRQALTSAVIRLVRLYTQAVTNDIITLPFTEASQS